jgi:hypothetical protein
MSQAHLPALSVSHGQSGQHGWASRTRCPTMPLLITSTQPTGQSEKRRTVCVSPELMPCASHRNRLTARRAANSVSPAVVLARLQAHCANDAKISSVHRFAPRARVKVPTLRLQLSSMPCAQLSSHRNKLTARRSRLLTFIAETRAHFFAAEDSLPVGAPQRCQH